MQAQTNPNEDTEFNDALRAHGILPPKPPSRSPSPEPTPASEVRDAQLKRATVAELDEELDLLADDGKTNDEEEQRLRALRRKRLEDLMKEQKKGQFGRVYPIARQDYTREVTDASKAAATDVEEEEVESDEKSARGENRETTPPKGTGVVCFLYKDGVEQCRLLAGYLDTLAAKYPSTKFVSIVGDKCIPNYPDKNLPTMLVYRNGELHRQIIGLRREIGLDGMNTKLEDVELVLLAIGVIRRSSIPGSARYAAGLQFNDADGPAEGGKRDDEDEDEGFGGNRAKTTSTIRQKTLEEQDDELDWD